MKKVMQMGGYFFRAKLFAYLLLLGFILYALMNVFELIST
jgi:hypothetical protein